MNRFFPVTLLMAAMSTAAFAQEDLIAPPSIFTPSDTSTMLPADWLIVQDISATVIPTEEFVEEKPEKKVLLPEKNFQTFIKVVNKRSNQSKKITLLPESFYQYDDLKFLSYYCIENYGNVYQNDVAFVDVETVSGDVLFSGWIYRKFPSVSGLQDPVYALTLVGCKTSDKPLNVSPETVGHQE